MTDPVMTTISGNLFAEALRAVEIRHRIVALDAGAPTMPWADVRKKLAAG